MPTVITNWSTNPSLETNTVNWSAAGGLSTVTRDTSTAWSGAWCLKSVATSTGSTGGITTFTAATRGTWLTGDVVAGAVRVKSPQTGKTLAFTLEWRDVANGLLGSIPSVSVVADGTWQLLTIPPQTAPASVDHVSFQPLLNGSAISDVLYFDGLDIRLNQGAVDTYIDGDQGPGYAWTGTAHASTSTRTIPDPPLVIAYTGGGQIPANPDAPWRDGPSAVELVITKPGDLAPVTVTAGGISASWSYTGQDPLSAEVKTADLLAAFNGSTDLRARWLRWEHKTLGTWAGEISDVESDLSTGTTEIAAKDFSALLEARRIGKVYDVDAAAAGALFKRVIVDAGREADGYTWIRNIFADETGDPIRLQLRGGTVYDAIGTLEQRSQEEWWVDDQRQAWWARRRGSIKTGSVQLVQGRHITAGRYSVALGPVVNDLRVVPADERYATSQTFSIDDDASIKRFGRRQDQLTYTGLVTKSTLLPVAQRDLNRLKTLGDTISFDVVNVDGCFAWFREGDSILLLLPSMNRVMQVRVLVRTYDTTSGVLRVSADVEA